MSSGRLARLAAVVGGALHGRDVSFSGVSTDTRSLQQGELFVALRGPNFDGNEFVARARECGAAGALVERLSPCRLPQVQVGDTLAALGRFASHWRRSFALPVVAITGSNGKTTVKEMTAAILSQAGVTLATRGNLNNEIGVPLTLLRLNREHQFAVIEMGANHAGEIARLTAMTAPDVAIVTNAGPAHLEGFGSIAGVARAKGELFEGLRRSSVAVMNRDDDFFPTWALMCRTQQVLTFGRSSEADFRVSESRQFTNGHGDGLAVSLRTPDGERELRLRLAGEHNAVNAAAAAAAAWSCGVGLEQICAGLESVAPVSGRLAVRRSRHGARLIDDSYNANPASVQAALDLLAAQPGPAWLVLGDMGELGEDAHRLHALIGERARAAGIERLYTVGPLSAAAAERFGSGARQFDDTEALISVLQTELRPGVTVLIKASRSMHLEQVSAALLGQDEG